MAAQTVADAQWAFDAYEAVRSRLPTAQFPAQARAAENLAAIADRFDVFLLDAFGVLNIGESAIPGAVDSIASLQAAGKTVMVLSNAAGYPKRLLLEKYARLGFDFPPENVITSREVLLNNLKTRPDIRYGAMVSRTFGTEELGHLNVDFLGEDRAAYDRAEAFLLIGAAEWTEDRQVLLETSLQRVPRPVLVGNPDIVAPRETGLSREPGFFAHRLADATGILPEFFGKPFANAFDMAMGRLPSEVRRDQVVMVGDTLQTDILGGAAVGMKTALITDFGSLTGLDIQTAIDQSGITPDYILPRP